MLALAAGKSDPTGMDRARARDRGHALAGSSTLNRLELGDPEAHGKRLRYSKIVADASALDRLLVELFLESHGRAPRTVGDWAFVLWDASERRLFCSRDAVGARPFYYSVAHGRFAFASDMDALLAAPALDRSIDEDYLVAVMARQVPSGDRSIRHRRLAARTRNTPNAFSTSTPRRCGTACGARIRSACT